MVKKILLSLIGVLVFAAGAFAQAKQVRGSVVDENGAAVIGASVIVKGTTIGVSTDQQGFFVMNNVPAKSEELQISYLGYVTQDVKIRPNMQITLVPDEQTIESGVVTGMTKTDKRHHERAVHRSRKRILAGRVGRGPQRGPIYNDGRACNRMSVCIGNCTGDLPILGRGICQEHEYGN